MVMDMMSRGGGGPPPPGLADVLGMPQRPGPGNPGPGLGPTPGADSPNAGGSELEALDAILEAVDAYLAIPTVSEGEKLIAEKISTMAQQLKAQNEKMADQISGGSPAARKAFG